MDDARGELLERPGGKTDEEPGHKSRGRFVLLLLVVVGGFYLVIDSMTQGGAYFFTVDEAVNAKVSQRLIRVKGIVADGTWVRAEGSSVHDFTVQGDDHQMKVHFEGPMPDVFKEGSEVVATGRLDEGGVLQATEVTAKCPSKYEEGQLSEDQRKRMGLEKPAKSGY